MSLCVIDGKQCNCQPSEGDFCAKANAAIFHETELRKEVERLRDEGRKQLNYSIALQRLIEGFCRDRTVNDQNGEATHHARLLKTLSAELEAAGAQGVQWQPIETAPKDSTLFLAGWPDGRMCVLRGDILSAQKARATPTPEHLQFQCTHWMPLPAAPVAENAAKEAIK